MRPNDITPRYMVDEPLVVVDHRTGCWRWQRATTKGYGMLRVDGRLRYAHVVYWEHEHGAVPEGTELDHTCRNPACVNPAHLEPVSHRVNVQRGRRTRLTPESVAAIRANPDRLTQAQLAERFGVSRSCIAHVVNRLTW
jgi:hypothetical protein